MPYIKDTFSILAECAAIDLPDTRRVVRESEVRSEYTDIEEAEGFYAATAEMVPVVKIGESYYTEAQFMAPFMRDAGIRSMAEALDIIAEANKLPEKSVGLLIESEYAVTGMIEKACQKESGKAKDVIMDKIGKASDLAKDLKSKGYPVKRKMNEASEEERIAKDKEKEARWKAHEEERARKQREYETKQKEKEENEKLKNAGKFESAKNLFNFDF